MPQKSLPKDYPRFLHALKERIRTSQVKAILSVNREMIALYWDLGRQVVERQKLGGWGTGIIKRISRDVLIEFPGIKGFSRQNIQRMRAFYLAWATESPICSQPVSKLENRLGICPQAVGELPWGHNIVLIEHLRAPRERLWYAHQTLEHGWSRPVLIRQIESGLYQHQGKALTNFELTLPAPQAKRAQETLKEEYALDFLPPGVTQEKDIEQGIIENAQRFLLELGKGFAFIGRQQRLAANGQEHVVDLLLYNVILHSYVVIELKAGPFKSEHAGKLSSYLSAADALLRRDGDHASIGVILCRSKNRIVVEYALRDQRRPIGVACYRLTRDLPGPLRKRFPTARELEHELSAARQSR